MYDFSPKNKLSQRLFWVAQKVLAVLFIIELKVFMYFICKWPFFDIFNISSMKMKLFLQSVYSFESQGCGLQFSRKEHMKNSHSSRDMALKKWLETFSCTIPLILLAQNLFELYSTPIFSAD